MDLFCNSWLVWSKFQMSSRGVLCFYQMRDYRIFRWGSWFDFSPCYRWALLMNNWTSYLLIQACIVESPPALDLWESIPLSYLRFILGWALKFPCSFFFLLPCLTNFLLCLSFIFANAPCSFTLIYKTGYPGRLNFLSTQSWRWVYLTHSRNSQLNWKPSLWLFWNSSDHTGLPLTF